MGIFQTITMPDSIYELEELYRQTKSGHWFDKDSMRFFKSRLTGDFRRLNDHEALFISTEKGPSGVRRATVRTARIVRRTLDSGDTVTRIEIGNFGAFNEMTLAAARRALNAYEKGNDNGERHE